MFELLTPHKATFINSGTLSQKNRPADELPGVKINLEVQFSADALLTLSPRLHRLLFEEAPAPKKPPAQGELDGVPGKPVAKMRLTQDAISLARMKWKPELTGYTVELIRGTGRAASNILLRDSIVHVNSIEAKEPDQCLARFVIEAGNIPDEPWAAFARLKSRQCEVTFKAPEVSQRDLVKENEDREFEKGARRALAKDKAAQPRKAGAAERAAVAKTAAKKADPKPPKKTATEAFLDKHAPASTH